MDIEFGVCVLRLDFGFWVLDFGFGLDLGRICGLGFGFLIFGNGLGLSFDFGLRFRFDFEFWFRVLGWTLCLEWVSDWSFCFC